MADPPWVAQNIIVTLDFDGCVAVGDFLKIKYAKILHGIDIKPEHCSKGSYPKGPEKYTELMDVIANEHILEYFIEPECKRVLNSLFNQGFRFAIVTSRDPYSIEACKRFCKYHKLPIEPRSVHSTGRKKGEPELIEKDVLVKKLRSRAMIDDTFYKLKGLAKANTPALLFLLKREWSGAFESGYERRIWTINKWREFESGLLFMRELHEAICYYQGWKNDFRAAKDIFNFWWLNPEVCENYVKKYRSEIHFPK